MKIINIETAKNDLAKLVSSCINFNDKIRISTKKGDVIMISESDYKFLIESLSYINLLNHNSYDFEEDYKRNKKYKFNKKSTTIL